MGSNMIGIVHGIDLVSDSKDGKQARLSEGNNNTLKFTVIIHE